jgi:hypothetical protein
MEPTEAHVGKLEAQLAEWGAKLDELVKDAAQADSEAQQDYNKRVAAIKVKYEVAHTRLSELRTASGEKWDTFKAGVEVAWKDLEAAFQSLSN